MNGRPTYNPVARMGLVLSHRMCPLSASILTAGWSLTSCANVATTHSSMTPNNYNYIKSLKFQVLFESSHQIHQQLTKSCDFACFESQHVHHLACIRL